MYHDTISHDAPAIAPPIILTRDPRIEPAHTAPTDALPAMIRDGDAWQRIDHDLHGFPHHAGTIRAGVFLVEIWQADPFFGGDEFGYMVQVECVWAEFFLLRDLGELLGLLAELRGIKK